MAKSFEALRRIYAGNSERFQDFRDTLEAGDAAPLIQWLREKLETESSVMRVATYKGDATKIAADVLAKQRKSELLKELIETLTGER